jgi:hypothetical protein
MLGQLEFVIAIVVLALAVGGGAVFYFLLSVDNEKDNVHILPHEDEFNRREAELEEEKQAA